MKQKIKLVELEIRLDISGKQITDLEVQRTVLGCFFKDEDAHWTGKDIPGSTTHTLTAGYYIVNNDGTGTRVAMVTLDDFGGISDKFSILELLNKGLLELDDKISVLEVIPTFISVPKYL